MLGGSRDGDWPEAGEARAGEVSAAIASSAATRTAREAGRRCPPHTQATSSRACSPGFKHGRICLPYRSVNRYDSTSGVSSVRLHRRAAGALHAPAMPRDGPPQHSQRRQREWWQHGQLGRCRHARSQSEHALPPHGLVVSTARTWSNRVLIRVFLEVEGEGQLEGSRFCPVWWARVDSNVVPPRSGAGGALRCLARSTI